MEYKNLIGGVITDKISIYNCDCMELLKQTPNNYYSLALVDPPYGIDAANILSGEKRKSGKGLALKSAFQKKDWDKSIPSREYFNELKRVSKNQIIWGGNYFADHLNNSQAWIVWDKLNGTTKFADCELAYTSFNKATRIFKFMWNGMLQGDMKNKQEKYHPTQKPYQLYKFCLENYAKPGDKILDTHLGSGSIAIACHDYGFDLTACELDEDYYTKAMKRINDHVSQQRLF